MVVEKRKKRFVKQKKTARKYHDSKLECIFWQLETFLDASKQIARRLHFLGSVHFRFDNVNRSGTAVANSGAVVFQQVMLGTVKQR